jgi:AcrR family transcriptional regulator
MSQYGEQTREKIVRAALTLLLERGIGKTSLGQVAHDAGVTRVTVYRYFADKRALVREVFLRVEQIFQKGLADLEQNPQAGWESVLDQIGQGLSALPKGDVSARSDELRRLYPDIYSSIQKVRTRTLNGIFDHLFATVESEGLLRPGLNRPIVQAIFWELVVNFFDNPRFKSFGLSDAGLYHVMTDILLHGVLSQPTRSSTEPSCS